MKEQLNTNTLETVFEISMDSAQHFSKRQVKFWESLCHCIYCTRMLTVLLIQSQKTPWNYLKNYKEQQEGSAAWKGIHLT